MSGKNLGTKPAKNTKRTFRYAVVPPEGVYNWLGMNGVTSWVFFPELRGTWWSEKTVAIRERIQELYIKFFDQRTQHFTNLEKSMLKDGFHAPVNTITGPPRGMYLQDEFPVYTLPKELQEHPEHALCTHTFGGSRVIIAKKHNMEIPCFIYDFTNAFPGAEKLVTRKDILAKFPKSYQVGNPSAPIVVRAIVHTHQTNKKNDGGERIVRLQTIEKIRQELKREGVL